MKIYVALVHYPVLNRKGETITSAVTNLDIHDIARVAATYDLEAYFVVTPLPEQQELVRELTGHWIDGGSSNTDRKTALSMVRIVSSLEEIRRQIKDETGHPPVMIATSARRQGRVAGWQELRREIDQGKYRDVPLLLLFGTASGLADQVFKEVDATLEPIEPQRLYNHLSVRSAVAITIDRLCSERQ